MAGNNKDFMNIAFASAKQAFDEGEIPVGAVIVQNGEVLAEARNRVEENANACDHAEMLAISAACKKLGSKNLADCDLYVTLEPCPMCATAISHARIRRVYFGAYDEKSGGEFLFAAKQLHHKPEIYGGIDEQKNADLLKEFFAGLRK